MTRRLRRGAATEDEARRRHPTAVWVPDVAEMERRLRARAAGHDHHAGVTCRAYQEGDDPT